MSTVPSIKVTTPKPEPAKRLSLYRPPGRELTPLSLRKKIYTPRDFNITGKTPLGNIGNGHYQIYEQIGQGATATVDLALDTRTGKLCALKRPLPTSSGTVSKSGIQARFKLESKSYIHLRHPHIISIHDTGQDNGQDFIVSELMNGGTLRNLTNMLLDKDPNIRLTKDEKKYLFNDMLVFIANIAKALDYASAYGIVAHRDIKPDNILLKITALPTAKLGDFGLAKDLSRTQVTSEHSILGTIDYMSPEQVNSSDSIDMRSDLYAIGAILYEMATGKPPFTNVSDTKSRFHHILNTKPPEPISINPSIDPMLDVVIMKLLEKNPFDRYQSGYDVALLLKGMAAS